MVQRREKKSVIDRAVGKIHRMARSMGYGRKPIFIDHRPNSQPRYGYGKPPHPELQEIIAEGRGRYAATIRGFAQFAEYLKPISVEPADDPREPYWSNNFVEGLDPISLYAFTSRRKPKTYLEIGSGNSTKFVARAKRDHGLDTDIVSIDPSPRAEVDALCTRVVREPLENVDTTLFDDLSAGDILMIDGSHRSFMNSDVTVVFLEVLPRLKNGVLLYIDDIYLPFDYPPWWASRYYSEQFLLATLLLNQKGRYSIVLPCAFVDQDEMLSTELKRLWDTCGIVDPRARSPGNGFWMEVAGD